MIDHVGQPLAFLLLLLVPLVFLRALRSYADRSAGAKLTVALLRSLVCVLLALEFAGITYWWKGKAGREHVVYLVDVSDSVSLGEREKAFGQVSSAVDARGSVEEASLICFAESPWVAIPFGKGADSAGLAAASEPFLRKDGKPGPVSARNTNLERAVQVALAGFPAKSQKKIVLLTDGHQTDGDVMQQAKAAEEQHVQICPVPVWDRESRDVVVVGLHVPEQVKREEAFEIRCELQSTGAIEGRLRLYVEDYLAAERPVALSRGSHVETFRQSLEEGGDHLLQVHFESETEQPTENDKAFVYVSFPGRPRVLVISKGDVGPLAAVLEGSQFLVDRRTPSGAPTTMLEWTRYDAVILENVPALELGQLRMRLLRDYVARFGGGLVLTGGMASFGPGGYTNTPVEQASPVAMQISRQERPSTSVVLIVDDSRSMWIHGAPGMEFKQELFEQPGFTYLGLSTADKQRFVREVFKRIVLSLGDRDRVGVLGLTSQLKAAQWYVRLQRVTDKAHLIQQFESSFARRAYSILLDSMDEARFLLANDTSTYRQILLLTDGYVAADDDFYRLIQMFLSDGMSVSTVGVGEDCNARLLDELARWGGGRFYLADNLKEFGDVYEKEMTAPATQLLVERAAPVAIVRNTELFRGLDMNLAPDLFGYVRTQPKASSEVYLTAEGTEDPLLASWRYHAGKVTAFLSSACGQWATLWVKDWEDGYRRFWRQVVRGVYRERGKEEYRVRLRPKGSNLEVTADVLDANEAFVNGASISGTLYYLGERGDIFSPAVSWTAALRQTAPGRYAQEFRVVREGVYLASVQGTGPNAGAIATAGAILPTPRELVYPGVNEALLASLAQATGGKVEGTATDAAAFRGLEERRRYDFGYSAAILAGLLLALEVLIRRWPAFVAFRRSRRRVRPSAGRGAVTITLLGAAILASVALGEAPPPPAPKGKETQPQRDQPPEMALSAAAMEQADKYMNLILEDPQNEFAFDQVYEIYESEKKTWKLLDFFLNAARLQRENGNLQLLIGMTYSRFRDYYKAAEHFQAALKILPNNYWGRFWLGRIFIKRGEPAVASEHLSEAVKVASSESERVDALFLLAEALNQDGKAEAAQQAWTDIHALQPYNVPALQRLAHAYTSHGLMDLADKTLGEILSLAEKNPKLRCDTLLARGELCEKRGQPAQAVPHLRQAQQLLLPSGARRREIEDRIRHICRQENRLDTFLKELEDQVTQRPRDVNLRKEIARVYSEEDRPELAAEHLGRGLAVDSKDVLLLEHAVEIHDHLGKTDLAASSLDRLYEISGGAPAYLVARGEMLWRAGREDEARATWKRILAEKEKTADRLQALVGVYQQHKLREETVDAYEQLLRIDPEDGETRMSYATYLLSQGQKDDAVRNLSSLLVAPTVSSTVFLQVADLYADHDMTDALLAAMEDAAKRFPEDYRIAKRRGFALERQQKYTEAIQAFFLAYDRSPNWREREALMDKLISLHLAYAEGQDLGRLANIVYKLYQDIQANPESPEPYMGLARTCTVYRPTPDTGYRDTYIKVPNLSALAKEIRGDLAPIGQMAAVDYYQKALERDPMRIDAYVGISRCCMFFDEFERSVMEYKKLAIVNPVAKWKCYFTIGDAFASQGQMPEARAFWDRVAARAFTDATLYFRLGSRYYWARQPEKAISMIRKSIAIYPDDYRCHLALGNMLAEQKEFGAAITAYREALRLSVQTMLLPVRRTMSSVQTQFARDLFRKGQFKEALDVYEEIRRFQEILNRHLGKVVPEYPDVLLQIARIRAKMDGRPLDEDACAPITREFPAATCWVSDHLEMSVNYLASLGTGRTFDPRVEMPPGKTQRKLPAIRLGYSTRVAPWVQQVTFSPHRILLMRRFGEVEIDPATGRRLAERDRLGQVRYFGDLVLRLHGGKIVLGETKSGRELWQANGAWASDAQVNSRVIVGLAKDQLQALDISNGQPLWQAPLCEDFTVTERYVTLKRVKRWVPETGGLEEHAHGDTESIGYIFQVLDAATGKAVFEHRSSGSHYWWVPVIAGDLVLLTDDFAHRIHAYDIASGKPCWTAKLESFLAAPPRVIQDQIHLYMRRPKLKTIVQYVLDPATGDIRHETDLSLNSLYSAPIPIGHALFLYDPIRFDLVGIDRETGGILGRFNIHECLTEGSDRHVITLYGHGNQIFLCTQDGLVLRFDVTP